MKKNKTTIIYNQLKKDIQDGIYKPNERITENEVAIKFDTSRNTVRNVLSLLEKDNIVKIERHKGARVVSLNLQDIVHLYELREEIEGYVFRKAVPHMTEDDLKEMEELYTLMEERVENNIEGHPDLNKRFHNVVYKRCENKRALDILRDIKLQVASYNFKTILIPGRKEQNLIEHRKILDAVKLRDADSADQVLRTHIQKILQTIVDFSEILN